METRGLASYEEKDCPVCVTRVPGECDACHIPMPEYPNMGRNGYQSRSIDHWHFRKVTGRDCMRVVTRKLCQDCYKKDYEAFYPNVEWSPECTKPRLVDPAATS